MARVVICGGGYAGIQAALELGRVLGGNDETMLVDKNEHHALLPSLPEAILKRGFYQIPYKDIFDKKKRVKFVQSTIKSIDLDKKHVATSSGQIDYDVLVVALGGRPFLPDIPGLAKFAYQFNDIVDVEKIVRRLSSFENGNIVIAGGGATGVEVAGEIAAYLEAAKKKGRITLVSTALLDGFPDKSRSWVKSYLQSLGVKLLIGPEFRVSHVEKDSVALQGGQTIKSDLLIWAGGIKASPVPKEIGLTTGDRDRIAVNQYLQSVDRPEVFVVGDCALILDSNGRAMPTNAQFAEQHGKLAARNIEALLAGKGMKKYVPSLEGFAISVGPSFAVARFGTLDQYGGMASNLKKLIKMKYLKEIAGVSTAAKDYASSRF